MWALCPLQKRCWMLLNVVSGIFIVLLKNDNSEVHPSTCTAVTHLRVQFYMWFFHLSLTIIIIIIIYIHIIRICILHTQTHLECAPCRNWFWCHVTRASISKSLSESNSWARFTDVQQVYGRF
jgi:hypothetical protein